MTTTCVSLKPSLRARLMPVPKCRDGDAIDFPAGGYYTEPANIAYFTEIGEKRRSAGNGDGSG